MRRTLWVAVAQSTVPEDPTEPENPLASGSEIRQLMREASATGAQLVQFPESSVTYPSKHGIAAGPAGTLTAVDWNRDDWSVMRAQAQSIADLAGDLGVWVVFGSLHPLTPPRRPRPTSGHAAVMADAMLWCPATRVRNRVRVTCLRAGCPGTARRRGQPRR